MDLESCAYETDRADQHHVQNDGPGGEASSRLPPVRLPLGPLPSPARFVLAELDSSQTHPVSSSPHPRATISPPLPMLSLLVCCGVYDRPDGGGDPRSDVELDNGPTVSSSASRWVRRRGDELMGIGDGVVGRAYGSDMVKRDVSDWVMGG